MVTASCPVLAPLERLWNHSLGTCKIFICINEIASQSSPEQPCPDLAVSPHKRNAPDSFWSLWPLKTALSLSSRPTCIDWSAYLQLVCATHLSLPMDWILLHVHANSDLPAASSASELCLWSFTEASCILILSRSCLLSEQRVFGDGCHWYQSGSGVCSLLRTLEKKNNSGTWCSQAELSLQGICSTDKWTSLLSPEHWGFLKAKLLCESPH